MMNFADDCDDINDYDDINIDDDEDEDEDKDDEDEDDEDEDDEDEDDEDDEDADNGADSMNCKSWSAETAMEIDGAMDLSTISLI